MLYATRSDIELIYGKANVAKWADVDNNGNQAYIAARIVWALTCATATFNNRLARGPYTTPFVLDEDDDEDLLDAELVEQCARLAGVKLYESRGFEDTENTNGKHKLSGHKKQVHAFLAGILSGRVMIAGVRVSTGIPAVVDLTN